MTKIQNLIRPKTSSESQPDIQTHADCFGHWKLEF